MNKTHLCSLLPLMAIGIFTTSSLAVANPVDLVLKLKEHTSIETLARSVTDPSSDRYQQFYTPAEIRALVAPSDRDYADLLQSLKQHGFQIVRESPSHLIVTVRNESTQVASLFKTGLRMNSLNKLAGATAALSIPSDLTLVESVTGLDQTAHMHPHYVVTDANPKPRAKVITQADIKTNYGFDSLYTSGLSGKGIHIAVATYDGFHMGDVTGFFKESAISPAPAVDQIQFNGNPTINEDSAVETSLDAEFSGMIAPGAQIHVFASAENSDAGELAMFTAILDDNRAKIVNYSWGQCETDVQASHQADMDKVYARAIAQGVNIMNASGDSGAAGCQGSTKKVAGWPASSPNIVAVGGTTYAVKNGKLAETAWSGSGALGGSGGGISTLYALPTYQSNFQSPYTKRSEPDVAFNANPASGQQVWTSCTEGVSGCTAGTAHWMSIGGTSMAAPQWSGFMALVGEARANAGKKTLGFLNPILYAMSASDKAADIHDITSGSNGYKAGPGWDAVTGWGSMQADALLNYLLKQ